MKSKSYTTQSLGELEMQVMNYLWSNGESDVQQVFSALGHERNISLNTIGSTLERLFKKKLALRDKVSRAYRYRAAIDREAYLAQSMIDAVGGVNTLREHGVLTAFLDKVADVSDETLDELEQLIQLKKEQAK